MLGVGFLWTVCGGSETLLFSTCIFNTVLCRACQNGGGTQHDVKAECCLSQGGGERSIECLQKRDLGYLSAGRGVIL